MDTIRKFDEPIARDPIIRVFPENLARALLA